MNNMSQDKNDNLVDGIYSITDLIDLERLQRIFDKFTLATGFTIGFLDHPGLNILAQSGWRDICTKFHRGNETSAAICTKSNRKLLNALNLPEQSFIEVCEHGMIDCAIPIIIKGKHIASIATGQLLLEPPDIKRFKKQAKLYGYDETAYLDALKKIPVVSEEELNNITLFIGEIASLISEMGYANLLIKEKADTLENEISLHKRLETGMKESEERYRTLFKTSPSGIIVLDENGIVIDANEEVFKSVIYSRNELIGQHIVKISSPDNLPIINENIRKILSGDILEQEVVNTTKDGTLRVFMLRETAITLPNGKRGILSVSNDITERKKAEDALRESEQYSRKIIENAPVGAHHYELRDDNQLIFIGANPAADSILGVSNQQFIGKTIEEAFPALTNTGIPDIYRHVAATGVPYNIEQIDYNDNLIRGAFEVNAFQTGSNHVTIFFSDITHRKVAERLLKQKSEEINSQNLEYKRINIELKIAKDKAEESDRLKSTFLANISHEIRTPMNGILNFVKFLKEPNLSGEKQKEFINIIEKSGNRLLNIINDLISISKIEAGMMEVSISDTNINELIESNYTLFKPEIENKPIHFSIKNTLPSRESIIYTDREKLHAILSNLIRNALKFTHSGAIEFGYEKKGDFFEFFVKDTGAGVPEEQKEYIFERFRQGSESLSRNYEGAGLGLSISKLYVEMLGGEIRLESTIGKGSTFYFTLPVNFASDSMHIAKKTSSIEDKESKIRNLNILIAEDDEASDIYLTLALSKSTNEMFHARTGDDAIEICRQHPEIDLILMDIKMAEMDGYEATRQIREFNKDVVIIAQTAYGLTGDREKAINAGCNEHILKPITASLLMELVEKFFNKH
jgi:PAS domain S-box-containing protein